MAYDLNNLTTSKYMLDSGKPGYSGVGGIYLGTAPTYGSQKNYFDQSTGQNWTQQGNDGWVGAGGMKVNDLPGYLQMRDLQKTGADFTKYQPQLDNTLASLLKSNNTSSANTDRLNALMTDPNAIKQTPGYQFALDQGNQAINRSAAAKGMLGSGNLLAELAKYGQGMASTEYDRQIQREMELARLGQAQQGTEMSQVNTLADLMRNSQQFGLSSGYYSLPQNMTPQVVGGNTITKHNQPSVW